MSFRAKYAVAGFLIGVDLWLLIWFGMRWLFLIPAFITWGMVPAKASELQLLNKIALYLACLVPMCCCGLAYIGGRYERATPIVKKRAETEVRFLHSIGAIAIPFLLILHWWMLSWSARLYKP